MRLANTLLLLPALALAQDQIPLGAKLQSWYKQAKDYAANLASPIDHAEVKATSRAVVPITYDNWQSTLAPSLASTSIEPWMILVSGGNKTCSGRCGGIEEAWNKATAAASADPSSPNLGYLNCDNERMLCAIWTARPPTIWYIEVPRPASDQSRPATDVHIIPLNTTTTTAVDILSIYKEEQYKTKPVLEGAFHPFDGWLAKYKLSVPLAYLLTGFNMIPSWTLMVGISFFTRTYMNRRTVNTADRRDAAMAQAQAAAPRRGPLPGDATMRP